MRRDVKQLLGLVGVVAVGLLALAAWAQLRPSPRQWTTPIEEAIRDAPTAAAPSTAGRQLATGAGRGNDVSADFTVPAGCPRQLLAYNGAALDAQRTPTWANMRAVDADGQGVEATMADFEDAPSGAASWSLEPGRYAIEVESWNAATSSRQTCSTTSTPSGPWCRR